MAGGMGMRLRPYTNVLPKPLTPIDDRPVIEVVLRHFAACGGRQAIVCLNAKARLIRTFLETLDDPGLAVLCRDDREPSGTAGALRDLLGELEDDFLVLNADALTDADLAGLMERHRAAGAAATMAVHRRSIPIRYGVVDIGDDDRVSAIREKPTVTLDLSLGIYALSRRAIEPVLRGTTGRLDMPELINRIAGGGRPVIAARLDCRWFDIGEETDLLAAREAFAGDPDAFLGRPP